MVIMMRMCYRAGPILNGCTFFLAFGFANLVIIMMMLRTMITDDTDGNGDVQDYDDDDDNCDNDANHKTSSLVVSHF